LLWAAECEVEVGSPGQSGGVCKHSQGRAADPAGWVKTYVDPAKPMGGFTKILRLQTIKLVSTPVSSKQMANLMPEKLSVLNAGWNWQWSIIVPGYATL